MEGSSSSFIDLFRELDEGDAREGCDGGSGDRLILESIETGVGEKAVVV